MDAVTTLACELIKRPSVTPDDAGCQQLLGARLQAMGFKLEPMRHGSVENLWAVRDRGGPLLMFAGHTDVVPTGDIGSWRYPPFTPTVADGYLYGRGSADMKGSLAAMVVASENYVQQSPDSGSIAFLLTSDEEGAAIDGTVQVVNTLLQRRLRCDYCVIGEPSSDVEVGDMIRIGRRGSLNARLRVQGVQGHVAYPHLADNPIHAALPMLQRLTSERWDEGSAEFPPTSLQISNIAAGTGASNVIPGQLLVDFNLRFSTAATSDELQQRIEALCALDDIDYTLEWTLSGKPFLTPRGNLLAQVDRTIFARQGFRPQHSTAGGTSDGRFITALGCELVELGPVNRTIHQVDECVKVSDLAVLSDIYHQLLTSLLSPDAK